MFKDMTDAALQQAIKDLQGLAYNAAEIGALAARTGARRMGRKAGRSLESLLRDLDIAVAIKRQRQRAGVWTA